MPLTAQELHALAPIGALVRFSDGTPRPPERFKRKLREWEGNNGAGYFSLPRPARHGEPATFNLQIIDTTNDAGPRQYIDVVCNQGFAVTSKKAFEVEPRKPGTIIAYREFDGAVEVGHVWPDHAAAEHWARRNRYTLGACGQSYYLVDEHGELQDFGKTYPHAAEPAAAAAVPS